MVALRLQSADFAFGVYLALLKHELRPGHAKVTPAAAGPMLEIQERHRSRWGQISLYGIIRGRLPGEGDACTAKSARRDRLAFLRRRRCPASLLPARQEYAFPMTAGHQLSGQVEDKALDCTSGR